MINMGLLEEVKKRLVATYDPLQIYLFGSYAWGHPDDESDLDILIVVEKSEKKSYKRPIAAYDALIDLDVPNDILVFTKAEFDARVENTSTLIYKIKKQGKLVYAKS